MKILLSNDDGYNAPGIKILKKYLEIYGNTTVVAPSKNVSACSSFLSVTKKINIRKIDDSTFAVNGTSADCVHLATRGLLKQTQHQVISGINFGSNMGDDVIYSGTVAAAIEGRFCKYTPIAISIANREPKYLHDISEKLDIFLPKLIKQQFKDNIVINVNIPDIPLSKIEGSKITPLGHRKPPKRAKIFFENGKTYGLIGDVGLPLHEREHNDFSSVKNNYISITPVSTDMTHKILVKNMYEYESN